MSLPDEDLAARGRSIFERLRQERDPDEDTSDGLRAAPDTEAVPAAAHQPLPEPQPPQALAPEPEPPQAVATELEPEPEPMRYQEPESAHAQGQESDPEQDHVSEPEPVEGHEAGSELRAAPEPAWTPAPEGEPQPQPEVTPEPLPVAEPTPAAAVVSEAPLEPDDQPEVSPPAVDEPDVDPQRFMRPLPRVMAIANQKGGVGKTTTTVNLGASLAVLGYRVLVVDLDPQGNATTGLGINSRNLESSIYDVILHDVPLDDCVEASQLRNLFVAPATIDLAGAEIELVPAFSRELRLRRALEDVRADYDFVLIDCPPSLGLLTVNALSAASEVVVPIQCEYYALEGLGQLLRNVNLVQSNLNPKLELSAIVLTMYDGRTKLAEQVADEVRQHFGDKVCRNVVPRTVRLSEAPSFGQPIIVFDPSSRGALAYRELAREVSGGPPQRTG